MPIVEGVTARCFEGTRGGSEHYLAVQAPAGLSLAEQIGTIEQRYAAACARLGLGPETGVFRRVFLTDAQNQTDAVTASSLADDASPVALSIVQQPPLPGAKIALLAYHVAGGAPMVKRRLSRRHLLIERNGLRHLWSTRLCAGARDTPSATTMQTRAVFGDLIDALAGQRATLREHCVRTWLYIKDVDVFYQDMVDSRRELFAEHGLTGETHFIASTGIEGACADRYDLVSMDAYSGLDLSGAQISYLNDLDRLCLTKDYNVTFERGTRVAYADRAQFFISGTASIDAAGQIVHPGDVMRQLDRALANVDALLRSGGGTLDDMMHLIVYLRDPADFAAVDGQLRERFADLPVVVVQGAVCRPGWLVEVEGIAIATTDEPDLPGF